MTFSVASAFSVASFAFEFFFGQCNYKTFYVHSRKEHLNRYKNFFLITRDTFVKCKVFGLAHYSKESDWDNLCWTNIIEAICETDNNNNNTQGGKTLLYFVRLLEVWVGCKKINHFTKAVEIWYSNSSINPSIRNI